MTTQDPAVVAAKTILVVEDERIVAMDLQRTLIRMGYEVPVTAASADDAIKAASERRPDLVLMDIRIKGDRDGIETAAVLRERFQVPVVYLTAYADSETVGRAKHTEPHGYLCKPVKTDELRSTIEVALYKHELDRRLREREQWFSTTLRSIADAVVSADVNGRVTFLNPVAERLTGWKHAEALGKPVEEVLPLRDEKRSAGVANPFSQALEAKNRVTFAGSLTARGGSERQIADSTAPVVTEDGSTMGAVMVFRDVTDERRIRKELEQSDRLKAIGTLSAGMAHELNNPIGVVMANASFARDVLKRMAAGEGLGDRAEAEAALEDALEGARRAAKIVADLRTFARPTDPSRKVSLKSVLELSMRVVAPSFKDRAGIVADIGELPQLVGDDTRLGQLFVNILINAAQALDPSKSLSNVVTVRALATADMAHVTVTDTGKGMSAAVMARAFEPFFTTREPGQGVGLGLSICHGIVKAMGGDIRLESIEGKGTTVYVDLPLTQQVAPAAAVPEVPKRKPRLLVVDDEPLVRNAIKRLLGSRYECVLVDGAALAVQRLETAEPFDLVLLDLRMPGCSGLELHSELVRRFPSAAMRTLFMTGGVGDEEAAQLSALPNAVLDKGSASQGLIPALEKALQQFGLVPDR